MRVCPGPVGLLRSVHMSCRSEALDHTAIPLVSGVTAAAVQVVPGQGSSPAVGRFWRSVS